MRESFQCSDCRPQVLDLLVFMESPLKLVSQGLVVIDVDQRRLYFFHEHASEKDETKQELWVFGRSVEGRGRSSLEKESENIWENANEFELCGVTLLAITTIHPLQNKKKERKKLVQCKKKNFRQFCRGSNLPKIVFTYFHPDQENSNLSSPATKAKNIPFVLVPFLAFFFLFFEFPHFLHSMRVID